jgi:hypothetical protein
MSAISACPDAQTFELLRQGCLPLAAVEEVARHLEGCDQCATRVQNLHLEDALAELLRAQVSRDAGTSSPAVEEVMQHLRGLCPVPSACWDTTVRAEGQAGAGTEGEGYDFLAPPQAVDEMGRLGPYRILNVLGAGGMGVVFRAEDPELRRPVALKVMRPHLAASSAARQRVLREARAAAAVKHPHIVTLYHVGEDGGTPFLAMEYLEGESLEARLTREGYPPLSEALRIGREIAQGLAAAHERGLIHRDVKPANVWLEAPEGHVKLLDFGLARVTAESAHLTPTGTILGTPAYMAPEQADGSEVDVRADLFSLGCILYRLVTGQPPFPGKRPIEVVFALANVVPRAPRELIESLPVALSDLIVRLLAKDPRERPESARRVIDKLEELERLCPAAGAALSRGAPSRMSDRGGQPAAVPARLPEKQEPTAPAGGPGQVGQKRRLLVAAALLLLIGGGLFALSQVVFHTPQGTLIVEIDDPRVEARFKDGELRLYGADLQLRYTLKPSERNKTLPTGPYRIEVAGADGLRLDTEEFTLKQGDRRTVHVVLRSPPPVIADRDRTAAEWVLDLGGFVDVEDGKGNVVRVVQRKDLPAGPFRLRLVDMNHKKEVNDAALEPLRGLTALQSLNLWDTGISDAALEHVRTISSLQSLWIYNVSITDDGLRAIRELPELCDLRVSSNAITDDGLQHLRSLKKLTSLEFGCPRVTDAGLGHLRFLKKLTWLGIGCPEVTDAGLQSLAELTELRWLSLTGSVGIRGSGFKYLVALKKLEALHANMPEVDDAALAHLVGLPLRTLSLRGTRVTDAGVEHLKEMKNLGELLLGDSKVSAAGLAELRAALPRCAVYAD